MRNNKNILIGGLLAIVLFMAVGYAAFSTSLSIGGTVSTKGTWGCGIKEISKSESGATGSFTTGGTATTLNKISVYPEATLTSTFTKPGDSVTYTVTFANVGDFNATLAALTSSNVTSTGTYACTVAVSGTTATCTYNVSGGGVIKYTINSTAAANLAKYANNTAATSSITVKAEFVDETLSSFNTAGTQIAVPLTISRACNQEV